MAIFSMCSVEGCGKDTLAKGLCSPHYQRKAKFGDVFGSAAPRPLAAVAICGADGCERPVKHSGFCYGHLTRLRKHGDPLAGKPLRSRGRGWHNGRCTLEGCDNAHYGRGLCAPHYNKAKMAERKAAGLKCTAHHCENTPYNLGLCVGHYCRYKAGIENAAPVKARTPRGYKLTDDQGYVYWTDKTHPEANAKNGRVHEHRAVMAEKLGRKLLPGENVHHKNGNRSDNHPDNLELWVTTQPSGQRPEDLVAWAREILALYGPLVAEPGSPPALRVVA